MDNFDDEDYQLQDYSGDYSSVSSSEDSYSLYGNLKDSFSNFPELQASQKKSERNLPGYRPSEIVIEFPNAELEVAELPAEVNKSPTFPDLQKSLPIGLFASSIIAAVLLFLYVYSRRAKERKKYAEGNLQI